MIFENRYGRIDRVLHRLAFRVGRAQHALSEVEDLLFRERIRSVRLEMPVLVSALPRSGTTVLLNLLHGTGRFATHTYRQMPFVLCPLLWRRFSERFTTEDEERERAHGDGIRVSSRSPEAFEEVLWKHFWPEHYRQDRIATWKEVEKRPEFEEFLDSHMRKMILLRSDENKTSGPIGGIETDPGSAPSPPLRYLSKNNLNIARLGALPRPLRDAVVLVPFREPLQHAASMLRQHERFLRIHSRDPFTRRYMEAIGHHEFGAGLKPVDFGGWLDEAPGPGGLEFWVRYWVAAYRHVLVHATSSTRLISYGRLTARPIPTLEEIARAVDAPPTELASQAREIRPPRVHAAELDSVPTALRDEARDLYHRLQERASIHPASIER